MQDRFKFRAWSNKEHKYLDDNCFEAKIYHNATELLGMCLALDKGNSKYDYVFEQCTGLKDRNGQLIYEGDILNWDFGNVLVRWDYDDVVSFAGLCGVDIYTEIIGNIHENPELLKKED